MSFDCGLNCFGGVARSPAVDCTGETENPKEKRPAERGNPQSTIRNPQSSGFSLVEIMIVVVIIGLLAGVVTVNVRGYLTSAKQNVARQDLARIRDALDRFWSEYDRYPTNEEGLALLSRPTEKLLEPLLSAEPRDPWDRPYQYTCPGPDGSPYEVSCLGADGREGGSGADADISSRDLRK